MRVAPFAVSKEVVKYHETVFVRSHRDASFIWVFQHPPSKR